MQDADVLVARLAGQLAAEVDALLRAGRFVQPDSPAVKRRERAADGEPAAEVEERRTVEEEVALLREEQGEASEVDLALIDLGLGEVGIDREIGSQPGGVRL